MVGYGMVWHDRGIVWHGMVGIWFATGVVWHGMVGVSFGI